MRLSLSCGMLAIWVVGSVVGVASPVEAQLIPGTGNLLNYDDLEDPNWGYVHNFPKSSKEEDENIRYPLGGSNNRMWSESPKRGSPDVVKRCETPAGGLPGSTGSLYLRTRDSGIPGHPMNKQAQDDFILVARPCGVGYSPSYVVRVFLPEFQDWEQRQGVTFGIRAGMQGPMTKQKELSIGRRFLRGGKKTETVTETEPYYPGFFIAFNPASANNPQPYAQILLRSDHMGNEVAGPKITQTGWWTFGMSVTPDARCHFYAHAGISDLTAKDHLYSSLPYNIRGEYFNTIFFNVCSADNGTTWSTPWIIDDPRVYYSGPAVFKQPAPQQAQQPQPVKTAEAPAAAPNALNASLSKEIPSLPAASPAAAPAQAPAAAPVVSPAAPGAPAPTQAPAAPAAPPMLQVPSSATSMKPAAVQVPVVSIPPVPAPAPVETLESVSPKPQTLPLASASLTVIPVHPVPITAPSAAALQQPAPISSTPSGPIQPIHPQGVPVQAPSLQAISIPPASFTAPVIAGTAVQNMAIRSTRPIAPVPAPEPVPAQPFKSTAAVTPVAPVSASTAIPVRTSGTTSSKTTGIPTRTVSVEKSVRTVPSTESLAPETVLEPIVAPMPVSVQKPLTSTLSPVPPAEPESSEVAAAIPAAPASPELIETKEPVTPPPALVVPTLPKEEFIPARQMQQPAIAPLTVPSLPSVGDHSVKPVEPEEKATEPAAPAIAPTAAAAPVAPAPNPFEVSRSSAAQQPGLTVDTAGEEPPLTILAPSVDTTTADPAPVPTPPAAE